MFEPLQTQIHFDLPPALIRGLVMVFCSLLAAPLFDVPLIGLSLTAPLAGFLVFAVLRDWRGLSPQLFTGFVQLLALLFAVLLLSWAWNTIDGTSIQNFSGGGASVGRFMYWFLCSLLACRLFAHTTLPRTAALAFAFGVIMMSIFVLVEYLASGGQRVSGFEHLTTLTQNSYALQFSTFLPFVYYAVLSSGGKRRFFWLVGMGTCLMAVLVLSSRSSWGTSLISLVLFGSLYALQTRRFAMILVVVLFGASLIYTGWQLVPEAVKGDLTYDYNSLSHLDQDKSWQIRQLQIQKGERIFEQHPLIGIGPDQFRFSVTTLDLPEVFRGNSASQYVNRSAHNSYIQLLAEGGLAFIVPYGLLLLWLTVAGIRAALYLARLGELWGLATLAGFVAMSVHFWSISGLTGTAPWFMYGMTAAMIYRARWLRSALARNQSSLQEKTFASGVSLPYPG